jgi:Leucine-rich repeat (LRR) protein
LSGSIPKELGDLSNLTFLALTRTQISGSIPSEIGNLAKLDTLLLYGNQLTGPVPLAVAQLGGKLQSEFYLNACSLVLPGIPGNASLSIPDTQDYRDADLDGDGRICGITIGSP